MQKIRAKQVDEKNATNTCKKGGRKNVTNTCKKYYDEKNAGFSWRGGYTLVPRPNPQ